MPTADLFLKLIVIARHPSLLPKHTYNFYTKQRHYVPSKMAAPGDECDECDWRLEDRPEFWDVYDPDEQKNWHTHVAADTKMTQLSEFYLKFLSR